MWPDERYLLQPLYEEWFDKVEVQEATTKQKMN